MEAIVYYANNSSLSGIFLFCDELSQLKDIEKLTIDFSPMGRVEPFALLYTSHSIQRFIKKNKKTEIHYKNFHNKSYASHMAFFKSFGHEHGNDLGQARGSRTYLPITMLTRKEIIDASMVKWEEEQNVIERISQSIAKILSREENEEIEKTLVYSITEIMRNVFEHSEADDFLYCTQYWQTYDKVEIAIVDRGIGIQNSINKNPFINARSDKEAIQQVIMPGISSTNYKGAKIDTTSEWYNTGFGLYMTSRLARNGGEMTICSGFHCLVINESGKKHIPLGHYCSGTAVKLVIKPSEISNLASMLREFKLEGMAIAKKHEGVGAIDAPSASQYLTSDFK